MSFKLSVRQGPRPNLVFELDKPGYVIGREAGNDLVIEDPQVSRRHAQLTQQGNSYLIEDIGSTNGTYVNGKRVTAPTLLANGDMVGLADTVIIAVQVALPLGGEATVVSDAVYNAPPTVPAFTPPPVQPQPVPHAPAYVPPAQAQPIYPSAQVQSAQPAPVYAAPRSAPQYVPQYAPPPAGQAAASPADDKRRTIFIGLGCLGLLLVVMLVAFVAWSFVDCKSFSSVFPFLFPPFSCT